MTKVEHRRSNRDVGENLDAQMQTRTSLRRLFLAALLLLPAGAARAQPAPAPRELEKSTPATADQLDALVISLEKARSPREREALLDARRELVTPRLSAALLLRALEAEREGSPARALRIYAFTLPIARRTGDQASIPWIENNTGVIKMREGRYAQARRRMDTALALFRKAGDRRGTSWTLVNLAELERLLGRHSAALDLVEESWNQAESLRDPTTLRRIVRTASTTLAQALMAASSEAQRRGLLAAHTRWARPELTAALVSQAMAARALGGDAAVLSGLQIARRVAEQSEDWSGAADAQARFGYTLWLAGFDRAALDMLREAAQLQEGLGERARLAETLDSTALVHVARGETSQALALYDASLEHRRAVGNASGLNATLTRRLVAHLLAAAPAERERILEQQEQVLAGRAPRALIWQGERFRSRGSLLQAKDALELGRKAAERVGNAAVVVEALFQLGRVEAASGNQAGALALWKEALEKSASAGAPGLSAQILEAQAGLRRAQGEPGLALAAYQEAVRRYREIGDGAGAARALLAGSATLAEALVKARSMRERNALLARYPHWRQVALRRAVVDIAWSRYAGGAFAESERVYVIASAVASRLRDAEGLAWIEHDRGLIDLAQGRPAVPLRFSNSARRFRTLRLRAAEAGALRHAEIASLLAQPEPAWPRLLASRRGRLSPQLPQLLLTLGERSRVQGKDPLALSIYRLAELAAATLREAALEARALLEQGSLLAAARRHDAARQAMERALLRYTAQGDEAGAADGLTRLGMLHLQLGRGERAADAARKALHHARRSEEPRRVVEALMLLGQASREGPVPAGPPSVVP